MKHPARNARIPRTAVHACLAGTCLSVTSLAAAILPEERDVLEAFYQASQGEQWLRSDGWLEPGSDPCEWYGVVCEYRFDIDRDIVRRLELPDNGLSGTLDSRIFEIVHERLDLSGNAIGGSLEVLPASPGQVDLSNNALGGTLPGQESALAEAVSGTSRPSSNWYLDLSGNTFEGEVPESWGGPIWLSLAGNRLEGMPATLLEGSRHPLGGRFLDLSDNRFSGAIPTSVMEADFLPHNGTGRWGGGINLCWNDWALPESVAFGEWLSSHHVAGGIERCLDAERTPVGPELSGSWYDPERSGEGITIQLLDSGAFLTYLFTFDENGNQQWMFGVQDADETSVRWQEMLRTRGRFNEGLLESAESPVQTRGALRVDRLGTGRLVTERVYVDQDSNPCVAIYPPTLSCFGNSLSDRLEYRSLSRLAGLSCDDRNSFQAYSGAWYNRERSGEGFVVEVLPDGRAVVYWFTYTPDGSGDQAWMIGQGVVASFDSLVEEPPPGSPVARIEIDELWQPTGAAFGPPFDAGDVDYQTFIFPGIMIALSVLAFNFIGDGLRERLDPRQQPR